MSSTLPTRPLPLVGVTPTKMLGGVGRLDAAAAQAAGGVFHILRLDEALAKHWPTDAWVVPYRLTGVENLKAGWPRFRQEALADVRAKGADIVATMLILDFDLPKIIVDGKPEKQRWTESVLDAFLAKFEAANEAGCEFINEWTAFYTTNHGARLIFVLDKVLPVESYKPYMRALIAAFANAGIPIEGTTECLDWTHLFRLPFVVDERYGEPTKPHVFEIRAENRLQVERLTPIGPNDAIGIPLEIRYEHNPRPTESEVEALLTESFMQIAKKWLKGHACYSCLFEHAKIAPVGRRDDTLTSYIGDAVNQLFPRGAVTKEHIYALFYQAVVTTLQPDADTPDWLVKLWDLTERFWAKALAEAEHHQQLVQNYMLTSEEKKLQVLQGMREWCGDPRLHNQVEAVALQFMSEHLVATTGEHNFVCTLNGRYDNIPVKDRALPARVRELGMDSLIQLTGVSKDGTPKSLAASAILRNHGTVVSGLQAQLGDFGGWISNIETDTACLNVKTFARRPDLQPLYNEGVNEWLRVMAGFKDDVYEKLCKWIGLSLAFDKGAICALAIIGRQGCGKKMLCVGLAEAITTQRYVDASEVFDNFNAGLLSSPFVVVDEGWPGGIEPADYFRRMTGGNTNVVKKKFLDNTTLVSPLRLILLANNNEIILDLAGKKDLSRRDQEALEIRLLPIEVPDEATDWIRQKGGHEFTNGWIRGDGGQPSKWILARHFLWLYEKYKMQGGPRFLVEGCLPMDMQLQMRTHGGAVQPVIETLLVMAEGLERNKQYKGCALQDGKIYVTTKEVLDQFRNSIGRLTRRELSNKQVGQALNALNSRQTASIMLRSKPDSGKQRWHELDAQLLHLVAERDGRPVEMLRKIVEGAEITQLPSEPQEAKPAFPRLTKRGRA